MKNLISLGEWSAARTSAGLNKVAQSRILRLNDDSELHRMLRQSDNYLVDELDTMWRRKVPKV
jgi:hypothetical protein